MEKNAIRQDLRAKRKAQSPSIKKEKDVKIHSRLVHLSLFRRAKRVLFYAPIPHEKEVETWNIMKKYFKKKIITLPVTNKKDTSITLKIITSLEDTELRDLNFPEPKKHCKEMAPGNIDLAIIPGIGFDKDGNRLGFGHGYYDRLLKKLHCPVVALAYDFQILHAIPRHKHDMRVHTIVTEKKIYHAQENPKRKIP